MPKKCSVTIPEETLDAVKAYAAQMKPRVLFSSVVDLAIQEYLARQQPKMKK